MFEGIRFGLWLPITFLVENHTNNKKLPVGEEIHGSESRKKETTKKKKETTERGEEKTETATTEKRNSDGGRRKQKRPQRKKKQLQRRKCMRIKYQIMLAMLFNTCIRDTALRPLSTSSEAVSRARRQMLSDGWIEMKSMRVRVDRKKYNTNVVEYYYPTVKGIIEFAKYCEAREPEEAAWVRYISIQPHENLKILKKSSLTDFTEKFLTKTTANMMAHVAGAAVKPLYMYTKDVFNERTLKYEYPAGTLAWEVENALKIYEYENQEIETYWTESETGNRFVIVDDIRKSEAAERAQLDIVQAKGLRIAGIMHTKRNNFMVYSLPRRGIVWREDLLKNEIRAVKAYERMYLPVESKGAERTDAIAFIDSETMLAKLLYDTREMNIKSQRIDSETGEVKEERRIIGDGLDSMVFFPVTRPGALALREYLDGWNELEEKKEKMISETAAADESFTINLDGSIRDRRLFPLLKDGKRLAVLNCMDAIPLQELIGIYKEEGEADAFAVACPYWMMPYISKLYPDITIYPLS